MAKQVNYDDCWTYPKKRVDKMVESVLPPFTVADAGKVLAVNSAGTGLEWASTGGDAKAETKKSSK